MDNPRAYLTRIATNLWIDRVRRRELERSVLAGEMEEATVLGHDAGDASTDEVRDAARALPVRLTPRERAAVLMKDVLDLSLDETASILKTSTAAVKAALHRGQGAWPLRRLPRAASYASRSGRSLRRGVQRARPHRAPGDRFRRTSGSSWSAATRCTARQTARTSSSTRSRASPARTAIPASRSWTTGASPSCSASAPGTAWRCAGGAAAHAVGRVIVRGRLTGRVDGGRSDPRAIVQLMQVAARGGASCPSRRPVRGPPAGR